MLSYQQATDKLGEAEALIQSFQKWVNEWEEAVLREGKASIEKAARNMVATYKRNVEKAYSVDDAQDAIYHHEDACRNATYYASRGC